MFKVYAMVERIVEVLSQESGDGDDSYMAINHVRDRLILPQERKSKNCFLFTKIKADLHLFLICFVLF